MIVPLVGGSGDKGCPHPHSHRLCRGAGTERKGLRRLSDVARVADIQAPVIYYYFDSREALIEEVVRSGVALVRERVTELLDRLPEGTSPIERIEAAVAAHLEYVLHASDLTTAAIRNGGQLPENMRARQLAEQESYGDLWRHCSGTHNKPVTSGPN